MKCVRELYTYLQYEVLISTLLFVSVEALQRREGKHYVASVNENFGIAGELFLKALYSLRRGFKNGIYERERENEKKALFS